MNRPSVERVLLVGFMGSGKSTVGRILANRVGWAFIDLDVAIERDAGRTIPEIFEDSGESGFRRIEASVASECLRDRTVVLATGGGWASCPGNWEAVSSGTVSVWLDVSPEESVRRVRRAGGGRPLLASEDPLSQARTLLAVRRADYARADHRVTVDGIAPDAVAEQIEVLAFGRATQS